MDLSTRVKKRDSFDDTDFSMYFTCSFKSVQVVEHTHVPEKNLLTVYMQFRNTVEPKKYNKGPTDWQIYLL